MQIRGKYMYICIMMHVGCSVCAAKFLHKIDDQTNAKTLRLVDVC